MIGIVSGLAYSADDATLRLIKAEVDLQRFAALLNSDLAGRGEVTDLNQTAKAALQRLKKNSALDAKSTEEDTRLWDIFIRAMVKIEASNRALSPDDRREYLDALEGMRKRHGGGSPIHPRSHQLDDLYRHAAGLSEQVVIRIGDGGVRNRLELVPNLRLIGSLLGVVLSWMIPCVPNPVSPPSPSTFCYAFRPRSKQDWYDPWKKLMAAFNERNIVWEDVEKHFFDLCDDFRESRFFGNAWRGLRASIHPLTGIASRPSPHNTAALFLLTKLGYIEDWGTTHNRLIREPARKALRELEDWPDHESAITGMIERLRASIDDPKSLRLLIQLGWLKSWKSARDALKSEKPEWKSFAHVAEEVSKDRALLSTFQILKDRSLIHQGRLTQLLDWTPGDLIEHLISIRCESDQELELEAFVSE